MDEPLVILGARGGGGSGKGISYYRKLLGCIRRATLSAEDDEYEDTEDSAVGKAGHALLEHYHLDHGGIALPFQTSSQDATLVEATRLFAAYRERFAPASLGEVLGVEVPLSSAYDGIPVTARVDMVVRIDADDRARIAGERGVYLERDGVYIVDHKFKKAHTGDLVVSLQMAAQFPHYMNLWTEKYPDEPAVGALANVIFRYKNVSEKMFKLIPIEPPSELDMEFVKGIVRDGHRNLQERGPNWANSEHCFDFHRQCPHLFYCDRTNKS